MNLYFSADLHCGHGNIIAYCHRPFKDVDDQHRTCVRKFNERVKDEDTVFHVGDFCFRNSAGGKKGEGTTKKAADWQKDFKGTWIHVKGNHDGNNSLKTPVERIYIRHGGKRICLVHSPVHADPHCELNFVGHIHDAWKIKRVNDKSIMVNVGVDVWDFRPVTFDEIMKALALWKKGGEKPNGRNFQDDKSGKSAVRKEKTVARNEDNKGATQKEFQSPKMG